MSSKRHAKRKRERKLARQHDGKQIHLTESEAIAHAVSLRRISGARVSVYSCGVGRDDPSEPRHWHVGRG